MALTRAGRADEGRAAMARFQELRDNPAVITYSNTYLAQGRYAEAIVSTGLEPELVDNAVPDVGFVDATDAILTGGDTSFDEAHVAALRAARAPTPSALALATTSRAASASEPSSKNSSSAARARRFCPWVRSIDSDRLLSGIAVRSPGR